MKSFAIKLTDDKLKEKLIHELEQINISNFYLSSKDFRKFKNVIIHYSGNEVITCIILISDAIANVIQKEYDEYFINKIIHKNYFYISLEEQNSIKRIAYKIQEANKDDENISKEILKNLIFEYLLENKAMILEGFINFRIKEYIDTLDYIVELAVVSYLNVVTD